MGVAAVPPKRIVAQLVKVIVARRGIEPPMPAFSGPLIDQPKWFWNQQMSLKVKGFCKKLHRIAQGDLAHFRIVDVRVLYVQDWGMADSCDLESTAQVRLMRRNRSTRRGSCRRLSKLGSTLR